MKWFRSNIRQTARLALLAMALQIGLSFGHVHGLAVAQAAPSAPTGQLHDDASPTGAAPLPTMERQAPAAPEQDQPPVEACAICAVISMAGAVLLSPPPLLLLPDALEFVYLLTTAELDHIGSPGSSFQPRAPPES